METKSVLFLLFTALLSHTSAMSQNTPCRFDEVTLAFVGTAVEQARCLLRPNAIGGVLGAELKRLPRRANSHVL